MEIATAQTIAMLFLFLWTLATTIYALYMQRKNNETYNKKILETLQAILIEVKK